jgi:cyclomaltodextrinase
MLLLAGPLPAAEGEWPPVPPLAVAAETHPGEMPPSVTAVPDGRGGWTCTFRYEPEVAAPPQRVALAGTFNEWNAHALPLRAVDGGAWEVTLPLPSGAHEYKFVLDGTRWMADPRNPHAASDNRAGHNSVLRLGRLAQLTRSEARAGDGVIEASALEHRPELPLYWQVLAPDHVLVRYRTLANDVTGVRMVVRGAGSVPLRPVKSTPLFTWHEGEMKLDPQKRPDDAAREIEYTFVVEDGAQQGSHPRTFTRRLAAADVFHTPEWARHAVWYQIMPDRFRNGNPDNDPPNVHPWTSAWFRAQPYEQAKQGQTFYQWFVFDRLYGGDFDGIEEQLPYLKELGVNALYLNPVFIGDSHHKYNATNYLHIDPGFGAADDDYEEIVATEDLLDPSTWKWTRSDKRFLAFVRAAHAQGFKVVIDGVFNHVGTRHPAFQDVKQKGRASRFADWFDVTSWEPFEYKGWAGHDALPEFKKTETGLASKSATEHIFAVTRRWMDPDGDGDPRDGIDGWRLDVPNELPAPFWAEWRKLVKSINPDAYITGEIWDRADTWLDGRHFDAVMNYPFARAVVAWVIDRENKITVSELNRRLRELRLAYPLAATLVMQNLYGSHDTDRVASMALNPDRAYDEGNRIQDNGPDYNNDKPGPAEYQRVRLMTLIQMTYVGAPMVYYGDEVGMWGADDPTCRKPMLWPDLAPYEEPDENFVIEDHLKFFRSAIALRNAHPALRTGAFDTLLTDDAADVWVFLRRNDDEQLIVAANAAEAERTVRVPLPKDAPAVWQGAFGLTGTHRVQDGHLELTVPALSGVVVHAATPR